VTVAGLLNIAQYLVDVEDAEFDPTSSTLKSLFNPLPDDISGLWERCCDLTLVGRSIVSKFKNMFPVFSSPCKEACDLIYLTDALRVRIIAAGEPIQWVANTLVPVVKSQAGFDSLIFGYHGENRKAFIYNEMKVGLPKENSLSKIVAAKLIHVVDFHFANNFDANQSLDKNLDNLYFNVYIYSSVVVDSKFTEHLADQLNELLRKNHEQSLNVTKKMKKEKVLKEKETLDRTLRFVQRFGKDHINVLNREDLDQWLLPSVVPIAALVQVVEGIDALT